MHCSRNASPSWNWRKRSCRRNTPRRREICTSLIKSGTSRKWIVDPEKVPRKREKVAGFGGASRAAQGGTHKLVQVASFQRSASFRTHRPDSAPRIRTCRSCRKVCSRKLWLTAGKNQFTWTDYSCVASQTARQGELGDGKGQSHSDSA